jgi:hypothetical protein
VIQEEGHKKEIVLIRESSIVVQEGTHVIQEEGHKKEIVHIRESSIVVHRTHTRSKKKDTGRKSF